MDGQAIKDTLGKNIKIFRARRGLSQADLAEKADISIPFLSNIERGIKYPQPDMLAKIANSLGVEVNELFTINLASAEKTDMLSHLSEDMTKNINFTMAEVFKRYIGKKFSQISPFSASLNRPVVFYSHPVELYRGR